jgi:phage terminase small subunit
MDNTSIIKSESKDLMVENEQTDLMSFSLPEKRYQELLSYIVNGGSVLDWCSREGVPFDEFFHWKESNQGRAKLYDKAVGAQNEWTILRVLKELQRISLQDIRDIYKEDGTLKPIEEWSDDAAACVSSIEVSEIWDGQGADREQIGVLKKVKTYDKMKGLQMIGKSLQMFIDRVDHSGTVTLEDLVSSAFDSRGNGRISGQMPGLASGMVGKTNSPIDTLNSPIDIGVK